MRDYTEAELDAMDRDEDSYFEDVVADEQDRLMECD